MRRRHGGQDVGFDFGGQVGKAERRLGVSAFFWAKWVGVVENYALAAAPIPPFQ
jgi:hypothetical protein